MKSVGHNCIRELKREKQAREIGIDLFVTDLKVQQAKIDKSAGEHKLADDEKGRIVAKFEKEIFVKLVEADRTDVLEEI